MKDFLSGRLAVGKKKVYAVTLHATFAQRCCDALSNTEYLRTFIFIQIAEIRCVSTRYNQDMARIDRLNVHKRHAKIVLINDAHFRLARYQFAKYAVVFIHIVTGTLSDRALNEVLLHTQDLAHLFPFRLTD